MIKKILFLLLCILFLCVPISRAQDAAEIYDTAEEETEIPNMLGLGALISDDAYKGTDTDVYPMPIIWWEHGNLYARGDRAGFIIGDPDDEALECSVFLQPRLMGYDDDDSNDLNGMADRDYSLDAGIAVEWEIPHTDGITLDTSFAADILGENKGQEAEVLLTKMFDFKPFFIKPRVGVTWQSEDMVDYYYGVRNQEATATRAAYAPSNALNPMVGLDFYLGLSEDWMLISRAGINFLDDEISDSPIVEDDTTQTYLIGITRMF